MVLTWQWWIKIMSFVGQKHGRGGTILCLSSVYRESEHETILRKQIKLILVILLRAAPWQYAFLQHSDILTEY